MTRAGSKPGGEPAVQAAAGDAAAKTGAGQLPAKRSLRHTPLSVLDLAPVAEGGTPADAFRRTLELARHAERLGYRRFWLAEHHNMPGIASSATSVVIGHVAGGTSTIRVGAGGIMLPNHAPLAIAEQFGTLASLYPGRIDLGLGRAPGSDMQTARALRRGLGQNGDEFPELLDELRTFLLPPEEAGYLPVRAYPGEGMAGELPIWLLGSSGFSARLAGELGLPFAFASHFSPDYTLPALELYRSSFRPSASLAQPYAIVGLFVTAADTDEEAARLATTQQQAFLNLIRGRAGRMQPPVDSMDGLWNEVERETVHRQLRLALSGSPSTLRTKLQQFLDDTQADELMIASQIFDHEARLHSYEILAGLQEGSQAGGETE